MAVNYVGVIVNSFAELKDVYARLAHAGYSESHSKNPHKMEADRHDHPGPFALGVDSDRDILALYKYGRDNGDVVCHAADVVQVAKAIFPIR